MFVVVGIVRYVERWVVEEVDEANACTPGVPIGVAGIEDPAPVRCVVTRAVRGVGAPIIGFLGVSVIVFDRVDSKLRDVDDANGLAPFPRRPLMMKGCRIAFWGFKRRSGSQ
jgi:hypothetical protein